MKFDNSRMMNSSKANIDFEYVWPQYSDEDLLYVYEVLIRGEISYNQCGNEIHQFEQKFAEYVGAKYCIALNSGTSGLYLAYLALKIQPGDEVIVPTYTFAATAMPLLHLGARITFVDSDEDSPCMSIKDLQKKVTKNTKMIIVTHMDGVANDIDKIEEIARKNNCFLVEDCAQAFGARVNGISVGVYGDIGVFSLQQKKILPAGEGGVLVTNNREIYETCILYSYLQKRSFDEVQAPYLSQFASTGLGFNFRIHPFQAALGTRTLLKCDSHISQRKDSLIRLGNALKGATYFTLPQIYVNSEKCSYYTFRILLKEFVETNKREQLLKELRKANIPVEASSSKPLHLEPIFIYDNIIKFFPQYRKIRENFINIEGLDNSVSYCKRVLRMKPYEYLNEETIYYVADIMKEIGEKLKLE